MAKYEFWTKLGTGNSGVVSELVEVPDDELQGKTEDEAQIIILKHHIKWSERFIYGDWKKIE